MARVAITSQAVIVVPVYKVTPSANEAAALERLRVVLVNRPVVFVTFPELDTAVYQSILPSARYELFDRTFFTSVEGYSRLLLLKDFYERFADFRYLLIYQTDAWVFSDELDYWCRAGFDYMGAPWFDSHDPQGPSAPIHVGNGGFSLRRTAKILRWFVVAERVCFLKEEKRRRGAASVLFRFLRIVKTLQSHQGTFDIASQLFPGSEPIFEDLFWCGYTWEEFKDAVRDLGLIYLVYFPWLFWRLRKPSPRRASRFAFEVRPSQLYQLNKHRLPFGCHAWEKWEPEFWRDYIR